MKKIIKKEIRRLQEELPKFIDKLPRKSYAKSYIKWQIMLQENYTLSQNDNYQSQITSIFNELDLDCIELQRSGLLVLFLKIELENTIKKNRADPSKVLVPFTEAILHRIENNPPLLNEISEYLFKYYENII